MSISIIPGYRRINQLPTTSHLLELDLSPLNGIQIFQNVFINSTNGVYPYSIMDNRRLFGARWGITSS